ncbi:hypothetical protein I5535_06900 [Rhodobacteraceae bacterium F11138]|nr:hypothetical protein [Rhodobacteraceae bacterium F11138]
MNFARSLFGALSACLPLMAAEPVAAIEDYVGRFGGQTSFYGQFTPSIIAAYDGQSTDAAIADNSHSDSRIGFIYKRPEGSPWMPFADQFHFRFETSLGVRESNGFNQLKTDPLIEWDQTDIRIVDAVWGFPGGSKLYVGHGPMATDGVTSSDLSGTAVVTGVSVPDMAGGVLFRQADGPLSNVAIKSAFNTFDGIRRARLRYDTRRYRGFVFAVSAGTEILQKDNSEANIDVALRYASENPSFRAQGAAGVSISKKNGLKTREDLIASLSILHKPTGLNFSVSTGASSQGGNYTYYKLGYLTRIFKAGTTAFSVDYNYGTDIYARGSTSAAWGLGVVQKLEDKHLELYLGYRHYSFSDKALPAFDTVQAMQFGMRYRF